MEKAIYASEIDFVSWVNDLQEEYRELLKDGEDTDIRDFLDSSFEGLLEEYQANVLVVVSGKYIEEIWDGKDLIDFLDRIDMLESFGEIEEEFTKYVDYDKFVNWVKNSGLEEFKGNYDPDVDDINDIGSIVKDYLFEDLLIKLGGYKTKAIAIKEGEKITKIVDEEDLLSYLQKTGLIRIFEEAAKEIEMENGSGPRM